jgi:hypothetical protein
MDLPLPNRPLAVDTDVGDYAVALAYAAHLKDERAALEVLDVPHDAWARAQAWPEKLVEQIEAQQHAVVEAFGVGFNTTRARLQAAVAEAAALEAARPSAAPAAPAIGIVAQLSDEAARDEAARRLREADEPPRPAATPQAPAPPLRAVAVTEPYIKVTREVLPFGHGPAQSAAAVGAPVTTGGTPMPAPAPPTAGAAPRPKPPKDLVETRGVDMQALVRGLNLPFAGKAAASPQPHGAGDRVGELGRASPNPTTLALSQTDGAPLPEDAVPATQGVSAMIPSPALPFRAPIASPPELSLEQYASICASLAAYPEKASLIVQRYGMTDSRDLEQLHKTWHARFAQDAQALAHWQRLVSEIRARLPGKS